MNVQLISITLVIMLNHKSVVQENILTNATTFFKEAREIYDISFESSDVDLFESDKKLGMASSGEGQVHLIEKAPPLLKLVSILP